jgi:chromosome segregation ATPase
MPPIKLFLAGIIIPTSSPSRSSPPAYISDLPEEDGVARGASGDGRQEADAEEEGQQQQPESSLSSLKLELMKMKLTLDAAVREKEEASAQACELNNQWTEQLLEKTRQRKELQRRLEVVEDEARETQARLERQIAETREQKSREIRDLKSALRKARDFFQRCVLSIPVAVG